METAPQRVEEGYGLHQYLQQQEKDAEVLELLKEAKSLLTITMTILSMNKSALYGNEIKLISRGEELVEKIAKATA